MISQVFNTVQPPASPAMQILKRRPGEPVAVVRRPAAEWLGFDGLRRQQAALLAGHMLFDGLPMAAIRFLIKVYPLFLEQGEISASAMAAVYHCTPQGAAKHVRKLEKAGYLKRVHYRAWKINVDYLNTLNAS